MTRRSESYGYASSSENSSSDFDSQDLEEISSKKRSAEKNDEFDAGQEKRQKISSKQSGNVKNFGSKISDAELAGKVGVFKNPTLQRSSSNFADMEAETLVLQ